MSKNTEFNLDKFIKKWSNVNIEMILELNDKLSNTKYFDKKNGMNIYNNFIKLMKDIFEIMTKDNRGYYSGVTLIIISLIIYYIILVG